MEIVELKELFLSLMWSLGVITTSMLYLICCMFVGRVTAEVIDFLIDWRRR